MHFLHLSAPSSCCIPVLKLDGFPTIVFLRVLAPDNSFDGSDATWDGRVGAPATGDGCASRLGFLDTCLEGTQGTYDFLPGRTGTVLGDLECDVASSVSVKTKYALLG